ncbi:MAG: hypothetical protein ABSA26_17645 [Thermoguttaceae bacterium]|jgi:hypothetical protein
MSILQEPSAEQSPPSGGGPFSLRGLAIWLLGVLIFATLVARAAVDAQFYFAPLVIFPLLTGVGLGGLLLGLMRAGQIGHRPTIISGAVLAVLIASTGEHYFCYLAARQTEPKQPQLADKARQVFPELLARGLQTPPESFLEYMCQQAERGRPLLFDYIARSWVAWLSWALDSLLVLAGVSAVLLPAMFLPFCGRCQTWYRAIRSAQIPASAVKQIGRIAGVDPVEHLKSGHCRLICCHSGCGPTGCELYWEDTTGDTFFARAWIDAAQRNLVMQVLDEVTEGDFHKRSNIS